MISTRRHDFGGAPQQWPVVDDHRRTSRSILLVIAVLTLSVLLAGCGGEADEEPQTAIDPGNATQADSGETPESVSSPPPTPVPADTEIPSPASPKYPGYRLEFAEGDFWRFKWDFSDRTCSQGSGCNTDLADGEYQITLGPEREWKGATVFAVQVTGTSGFVDGNTTRDFKLTWPYLGIVDGRIVGTNGTGDSPLVTLFDSQTGKWPGSGFFTNRFSSTDLFEARPGTFGSSNDFAAWSGLQSGAFHFVQAASSQGKCETIEGRRICPREESFSYSESEYYRPGVGPYGYLYNNTASFSGGGFTTTFQSVERVALIASSHTGSSRVELTPADRPEVSTPPTAISDIPDPIFGPVDGGLVLAPGSPDIPDFSSGLNVEDGIVLVTFENPDVPGNQWSHGITFRQSAEEIFHMVFIRSNGTWGHFARGGSLESEVMTAVEPFDFDTQAGGKNQLSLLVADEQGLLFINGEQVAAIDMSFAGAHGAGDVRVMSAVFPTDELNGATTFFTGFAVFEVPES